VKALDRIDLGGNVWAWPQIPNGKYSRTPLVIGKLRLAGHRTVLSLESGNCRDRPVLQD
jgi:hypothetical protein